MFGTILASYVGPPLARMHCFGETELDGQLCTDSCRTQMSVPVSKGSQNTCSQPLGDVQRAPSLERQLIHGRLGPDTVCMYRLWPPFLCSLTYRKGGSFVAVEVVMSRAPDVERGRGGHALHFPVPGALLSNSHLDHSRRGTFWI